MHVMRGAGASKNSYSKDVCVWSYTSASSLRLLRRHVAEGAIGLQTSKVDIDEGEHSKRTGSG
jgi:hypothetical protein